VGSLRRRKKKKSYFKSTIFIVAIITLSFIGVGYGAWNEGLETNVSIKTGELNFVVESIHSDSLNVEISNDGKTINISGEVVAGSGETVSITVRNNGTVQGVLCDTGSVIMPGELEVITLDICPEYSNQELMNYMQSAMSVHSLYREDENFDIDQILNDLYPTQTYSFVESYNFEQGL